MTQSRKSRSFGLDRTSFEIVAESIPHIVWLADADGSTDYFNAIGTEYTGFPRQANYGWQWLELVHAQDLERAQLGWQHATRSVTPFVLSYRIRRSDGEFRWHTFRALPVRGPAGEIVRLQGARRDGPGEQEPLGELTTQGPEPGASRGTRGPSRCSHTSSSDRTSISTPSP